MRFLLLAILSLVSLSSSLRAADVEDGKNLATLLNPEVSREINLRDDQRRQIRRIFQEFRPKLMDQRVIAEKAEADLREILNQEPPDQQRGGEIAARLAAARGEMLRLNTVMRLQCRAVLTKEQWAGLQAKYPNGIRPGKLLKTER